MSTGATWATLNMDGKVPVEEEELTMWVIAEVEATDRTLCCTLDYLLSLWIS